MNCKGDNRNLVHIMTYGCQMNEHDTEIILGMLDEMGYRETEREEDADMILFNTCCVRETAEQKVLGRLGSLKHLKEKNPELIIGIGGCMMQQEHMVEKIRESFPFVDLVFGPLNIQELPRMVREVKDEKSSVYEIRDGKRELLPEGTIKRKGRFQAWVPIIHGCNNFCTYCIVPHVRGSERSRPFDEIKSEVQKLAEEGYLEVTLLGQNVNSYGHDLKSRISFAQLLTELDGIPGLRRIRYMTSHPRDFDRDLVDTICQLENVCEHFHLPVQAGSDRILDRMNRGYTRRKFIRLVDYIQRKLPHASVTSDIIVGFPGETERDFQDTLDLVRVCRFDSAYTFAYSPRTGTPAAEMGDQLSDPVKKDRLHRLMSVQNEISKEKNLRLLGKKEDVLVEGISKKDKGRLTGRLRTNKIVTFEGKESLIGEIIEVQITQTKTWTLEGRTLL